MPLSVVLALRLDVMTAPRTSSERDTQVKTDHRTRDFHGLLTTGLRESCLVRVESRERRTVKEIEVVGVQ